MTREIYSSPGEQEDPARTKEREDKFISRLTSRENGGVTIELKRILKKIDFTCLKSLFLDIVLKCGLKERDLNFLGPDRIFSAQFSFDCGVGNSSYRPDHNIIYVEIFDKINVSKEFDTLFELIHEETHAISKSVCIKWRQGEGSCYLKEPYEESAYNQVGYEITGKTTFQGEETSDYTILFNLLNEGITEKLCRGVLLKYLDSSGWPNEETKKFKKILANSPEKIGYAVEVDFIDKIIKRLAEKNDQTKEVVWQALVRGLIEGQALDQEEVSELFETSFDPNFLKELSEMYSPSFFTGESEEPFLKLKKKHKLS